MSRSPHYVAAQKRWREFEIERWRAALRRGLQLRSLDPEFQRPLFENIWSTLAARHRTLFTRPRLERRLRTVSRAFVMAGLIAIGYSANLVVPAVGRWLSSPISGQWTHSAVSRTVKRFCAFGYMEAAPSEAEITYQLHCLAEKEH